MAPTKVQLYVADDAHAVDLGDNAAMRSPSVSARAGSVSPYLLLTLTPFFWACNWIIGRGLSTSIPPMAMTFYRWLFAILILAPFACPHVRREWPIVWRHRRTLFLLGIVGVGSHNALAYLGLNYTTAMNGVILNSFIPVMIIALSWIFLRQRLTPVQSAGVAVSFTGVLAILSQGSLQTLASFQLNRGDLLVILSLLLWSIYTICLRWKPAGLHMLTFLFVIACVGDAGVLPLYLAETAMGSTMTFTLINVAALLGVALFSSVLAYIFWNRGVEQVGANVAGLFVHLMPVFGTILAWLFLDERLHAYHVIGIAFILTGIYVTSRGAARAIAVPLE
jgi:drug/metabolite transporter (DMT)-like permease